MEGPQDPGLCDFCRLRLPDDPVMATVDGERYRFCSAHCRDAMDDAEEVFTRYHGHRRFDPGVRGLDAALPQGCPRNSFVLLSALPGARDGAVQMELAWRALQRGEPVVLVTFLEPAASLVERFVTLDWNPIPFLESGQLRVVDCFHYLVAEEGIDHDLVGPWNRHLAAAVEPATETVRDPSDVVEVSNTIENALDATDMVETGVVVIDSLTEFGTLVQPVRAYGFVKDLRADVCKDRFVPVFAGATVDADGGEFPHDMAYVADGVVDLDLDGEVVQDGMVKRLRVRKLRGVLSYQRWTAYEYTAGRGMVTFDPAAQMAGDGQEPPPEEGPGGGGGSQR